MLFCRTLCYVSHSCIQLNLEPNGAIFHKKTFLFKNINEGLFVN